MKEGVCARCKRRPARPGLKSCKDCMDRDREHKRKYRRFLRGQGRCQRCKAKAEGWCYCFDCAALLNRKRRERSARRRAQA